MKPFSVFKRAYRALAVTLIVSYLFGCGDNSRPSVESGPLGEQSLALDITEQQRVAREAVFGDVSEGLLSYRISPGDVLEVLYLNGKSYQSKAYTFGVGDRLLVDFYYSGRDPSGVLVRPDGMITLPYKGDVLAAGKTPGELSKELESLFADIYQDPRVTVSVTEYTSELQDLKQALTSAQRGRSQKFVVGPDGVIYMPYIDGLRVGGLSVDSARASINEKYREQFGGVEVSLSLDTIVGNRIFVFGEVANPGVQRPHGQYTVLQALAAAGGHLPTGSLGNVKVLYWSEEDHQPRLRTVNLERVVGQQRLEEDMLLPGNATVYVPPTGITKANRFVDQFLRKLFLFNGVSIGVNYEIDED